MKKRVFSFMLALCMAFSLISGMAISVSAAEYPAGAAVYDAASLLNNIKSLVGKTVAKKNVVGLSFIKTATAPDGYTANDAVNFASQGNIYGAYKTDGTTYDVVLYSSQDIYAPESMDNAFKEYSGLAKISFINFNTSCVTSMSAMFHSCSSLTNVDLSGFDTSNVTNMGTMFSGCTALKTVNIKSFNTTKLTKMNNMFYNCSSLTELDMSSFDTTGVTVSSSFTGVLNKCTSLLKFVTPKALNTSRTSSLSVVLGYNNGNEIVDFDKISSNMPTATALYRKFAITYQDGSTSLDLTPDCYYYGSGATLPAYSKAGFEGWYLTDDTNETIVTAITATDSGDKTFSAKITGSVPSVPVYHNVTLDPCEGTINAGNITQYEEGVGATLPIDVTRDGYTFKGWFTAKDGGEGPVTAIGTDANTDVEYFAQWEKITTVPTGDATFDAENMLTNLKSLAGSTLTKSTLGSVAFIKSSTAPAGYITDMSINFASSGLLCAAYKQNGIAYDVVFYAGGTISAPESLAELFEDYSGLTSASFDNFDTSSVTSMKDMFKGCESLSSLDMSGFVTTSLANMSYIFKDCVSLTNLDLSSFDTSGVSASGSFTGVTSGCTGLLTITTPKALNDSRTSSFSNNMIFGHISGNTVKNYDKFSDALPTATTLYRKFAVTYMDDTTLELAPSAYYYGQEVTLPTYSKTNEVFEGWYLEGDSTMAAVSAISSTDSGDKTFIAKWKPTVYHTVTLNVCGGTINEGAITQYKEGIGAKLPYNVTRPAYKFLGWFTAEKGGDGPFEEISATATTDMVFYAQWELMSSKATEFTITTEIKGNGSVEVPTASQYAKVITITVKPDAGYTLKSITVKHYQGFDVSPKATGTDTYTFKMPATSVIVKAEFEAICDGGKDCNATSYTDIDTSKWYHGYIDFVIANKIMEGVSSTSFDPHGNASRAMIATILYRMDGKHAVSSASSFPDVKQDVWYSDAIAWATANGIFEGYDDGTFAPDKSVTRQELAVVLYRYASYKGYDTSAKADLSSFSDADKVSSWAKPAMQWAVAIGLIQGNDDNTLNPIATAERCHIAATVSRYISRIAE